MYRSEHGDPHGLYALVLKPPPFPEHEKLVQVHNVLERVAGGPSRLPSSVPQYRDFSTHADLFEGFAMMRYIGTTIGEEDIPARAMGMRVNAGFFEVFGVQPVLGRFSTADEGTPGRDHVLVLTQTFWETYFKSDPNVIGRAIRLGGEAWTIIGVAPRSIEALDTFTQFFKPFESIPHEEDGALCGEGSALRPPQARGFP